MAEGALSGLVSNLLTTIASEAFEEAFVRSLSIWRSNNELEELKKTIQRIAGVLHVAEMKQEVSAWIVQLKEVLYEAEDLFDEVATNDLLKQQQQMKGGSKHLIKEVRTTFSKLNPIISRDSFARKVKLIRKTLEHILGDDNIGSLSYMLTSLENLTSNVRKIEETGPFVDSQKVIGRDVDKKVLLEFLFDESNLEQSEIIAVVGIGGMGKTTLAQLVYNDKQVEKYFERRLWANISDRSDEKEVLGRIFRSIWNESYDGFTISKLRLKIAHSLSSARNHLLVLDDVWDCSAPLCVSIMSLLKSGTMGSKIIVTTRSLSVAKAMGADQIYQLKGLPKEDSWRLFSRSAFHPEQENDPRWISLGKEIVERCDDVPLAIKSIATHLSAKTKLQEWMDFRNERVSFDDSILSTLRLSYDELSSNMKSCFAYCSLFPRDYEFEKEDLVHLWIGQGYMKPISAQETLETIGDTYFSELVNRCLFEVAKRDAYGETIRCRMHGLIQHLAEHVGRNESIILSKELSQVHSNILHASVGYAIGNSWNIPPSLLNASRLRSFLFLCEGSLSPLVLDIILENFKLLRALHLGNQKIGLVPASIGKLEHLRYLNLSRNTFTYLPDSIIMLVNLLTLDISWCEHLESLPDEFRKLINLRHLNTKGCYRLRQMPPGFDELTSLQRLSFFKVGSTADPGNSRLDALAGLDLEGELEIIFDDDIVEEHEEECWQLPINVRALGINNYRGVRVPCLETRIPSLLPRLVRLYVGPSSTITHLSPLGCLPHLETLQLSNLYQLEYIEKNFEGRQSGRATTSFFPTLKDLTLERLPKLKGWSPEVEQVLASKSIEMVVEEEENSACSQFPSLPLLSDLTVRCCQQLKFMPRCPRLQSLKLNEIDDKLVHFLLSTSFHSCSTTPSSSLLTIAIWGCDLLMSFPGETLTSLQHLELGFCDQLKSLCLASRVLEELVIQSCSQLELWEEKGGVDWDSFPKLCKLVVTGVTRPEKLPHCLQQRQANGELLVTMDSQKKKNKKFVDLSLEGEIEAGIKIDPTGRVTIQIPKANLQQSDNLDGDHLKFRHPGLQIEENTLNEIMQISRGNP